MPDRARIVHHRPEPDTDPELRVRPSTNEVEAIAAEKPGLIKRLAVGLALRLLPPLVVGLIGAVVAFVALQQQVGAVVAEVETVRIRGDVNATQIAAVSDSLAKLALAQSSIVARLDAADAARAQFWAVHWPSLMSRLDKTDAKLDRLLEALPRRIP